MKSIKLVAALCIGLAATSAQSFEIVDDSRVVQVGEAFVISVNDEMYAVTEIPNSAPMMEVSTAKPSQAEGTNVSPGCPMTKGEVIAVLEAWYKRFSIDYLSIKIRNIDVSGQQYIVWCDNPLFFVCSNWQIRSGTRVDYEVNGANRSNGMTGFQRTIKLIRKNPKSGICVR